MSRKRKEPYVPQEYKDLVNEYFRQSPKSVYGVMNSSAMYWRNWLLKKIFSAIEYTGFPDSWEIDYFNEHLFLDGVICITDTAMGVLPLQTGYTGVNVFNEPTECVIANVVLGNLRKKIGTECSLVKLQFNYHGVHEMIDRYSELLASCDSAMAVNLMNSKVSNVFMAQNEAQAATMKQIYDKISSGEPAVFVREAQFNGNEDVYNFPIKQMFVASDIEELQTMIKRQFFQEIGINAINSYKHERQTSSEVDAGDEEKMISIQHWIDNINAGFRVANKLFNLNLGVKLRSYALPAENEPETSSDEVNNEL